MMARHDRLGETVLLASLAKRNFADEQIALTLPLAALGLQGIEMGQSNVATS